MEECNYLGTIIDRLKFDQNAEAIIKKSHHKMFGLRKLNCFNEHRAILDDQIQRKFSSDITVHHTC